jgi:hypothetical protein
MPENFKADARIAAAATAYCGYAIEVAAEQFAITLDWSEKSVRHIEDILGQMHDDIPRAQPPDSAIWNFARAFGSYVGEVLRRHHGGEWGMVTLGGDSFPGIELPNGVLCWPWGRAYKRITNGPEDNIWHYYTIAIGKT